MKQVILNILLFVFAIYCLIAFNLLILPLFKCLLFVFSILRLIFFCKFNPVYSLNYFKNFKKVIVCSEISFIFLTCVICFQFINIFKIKP